MLCAGRLIPIKAGARQIGEGKGMWTYLPEHFAAPAPRYTSYPTAAEFHDGVGAADQAAGLAAVEPDATLSLYLHIPYCEQICWYCGCNTGPAGKSGRLDVYVAALAAEIENVARQLDGRGRIASIHFGGGSPNALSAAALGEIFDDLRRHFAPAADAEWAVELDPRGLDDAYIDALAAMGVTRVSLGVQTFAPHVQAKINRIQPFASVARAVERLRAVGIGSINFDLMYGLPGQMVLDVAETVEQALVLAPDRFAVFGYAHMPQMIARQRMIADADLPGTASRFAQARIAHQLIAGAGYAAIGFDHFARPDDPLATAAATGRLRRNFQGYTHDPADVLIGLGASAISDFGGFLVQNEKAAGRYRMKVKNGHLAGCRGVVRSDEDRLRGSIIERLLCNGVVDVAQACIAAGEAEDSFDEALARLQPLADDGLVRIDQRRVSVPPAALPYLRVVARAFDAYRTTPVTRFSRAI